MEGPSGSNTNDDEQRALQVQFQEMFDVDETVARDYLTRCGFSMEMAVQEFLNVQDGRPSNLAGASAQQQNDENMDNGIHNEHELRQRRVAPVFQRATIPPRPIIRRNLYAARSHQSWSSWFWSLTTFPVYFVYSTFTSIFRFLASIIFGGGRGRQGALTGGAEAADSVADVRRFVDKYDETYRDAGEHIPFVVCTYKQLMEDIKRDLRYTLVYLHSWIHEDTDSFCRRTLTSPHLREYMRENAIQLWAIDVQSVLGSKVSSAMQETTYPSLSLLCYRDNRVAIVVRMNGLDGVRPETSDHAIIHMLQTAIADNAPYLHAARQLRDQRRADTRLREEQEHAYATTLARDRERQRARDIEQEQLRSERIVAENMQRQQQHRDMRIAQFRDYLRQRANERQTKAGSCRVGISMPNGTRLSLQLDGERDTVATLYELCMANEACPLAFSLWTAHPRTQITWRPLWLTNTNWMNEDSDFANVVNEVGDEEPQLIRETKFAGQMIYVQDDDA